MSNLVWYKSDLRTYDNPALTASMSLGPTLAVYVLCPKQWQHHGISLAKQSLILRQLVSLKRDLKALNVPLIIIEGKDFETLPRQLLQFAESLNVKHIFWNKEYELNERRCEASVSLACYDLGIAVSAYDDSVLCAPGSITKYDGSIYKVFSAFKRAMLKDLDRKMRALYGRPGPQKQVPDLCGQQGLTDAELLQREHALSLQQHYSVSMLDAWPSGEDHVHRQLESFVESSSLSYDKHRDFPSLDATSLLSPYMAIGTLTTRQCFQAAVHANRGLIGEGQPGIVSWINELVWRDFYRHIVASDDSLSRFKPFKSETDNLPWRRDQEAFEAWKNGQTGFPIVDAAMRQLKQTGWMHNRLRMVVAMFLTKHLFIDWRWGESYFMSQLIDGDFSSNNGGWQWSASTGVDAVPYFRIFNPTRQSVRFDPEGAFIRRYVPELRHLSNKDIHQPNEEQALAAGYVLPLVDHKQATDQTKYYFSQLNKGAALNGA